MTTRDVSAQYNNEGVDLLEHGQYCAAVTAFKNALHTIMKAQHAPENRLSETKYDQDFTQRPPSRNKLDQVLQLRRQENSYVYSYAFRIVRSSSSRPLLQDSTSSCVQDTMAIIFNLSLVYHFLHLTGTEQEADSKNSIKALNCYEMVQALIMAEENQGLNNNDPSILLMLMASSNNMGQIHHSLGQLYASSESIKLLSSTLSMWHASEASSSLALDAVDLQGFSMNLTLLTEPGLAPAA
jgi:hypothetical protein